MVILILFESGRRNFEITTHPKIKVKKILYVGCFVV